MHISCFGQIEFFSETRSGSPSKNGQRKVRTQDRDVGLVFERLGSGFRQRRKIGSGPYPACGSVCVVDFVNRSP